MKARDDLQNVSLTSWECFVLFNGLIMKEKSIIKSSNDNITNLLHKLWDLSPDVDKRKALENDAFIKRAEYWGIKIKAGE